jgi:hypothetical protein
MVVDDAHEDESKFTLVLEDESELNDIVQLFDDCVGDTSSGSDGTTLTSAHGFRDVIFSEIPLFHKRELLVQVVGKNMMTTSADPRLVAQHSSNRSLRYFVFNWIPLELYSLR